MRYLKLSNRILYFYSMVFLYTVLFLTCCSSSHDDESSEPPHCEVTKEFFGIEDITPLGYSTQNIIDMLLGTWECDKLEWYDLHTVGVLYPDEKPNKITVTQSYEGGDIIFEHSVRVGDTDYDLACMSQLVIPTVLTLESSDGFFAETLKVTTFIKNRSLSSDVSFKETPSRKFNGAYDFVPNTEIQALPDSGTVISFSSNKFDETEVGAYGYILEYFWSEQILVETDPPTYDSWGATFTTVDFVCQSRNIDTVVSEENGQ